MTGHFNLHHATSVGSLTDTTGHRLGGTRRTLRWVLPVTAAAVAVTAITAGAVRLHDSVTSGAGSVGRSVGVELVGPEEQAFLDGDFVQTDSFVASGCASQVPC